ncbi:hypothetical protein PVAP13_6NG123300 [Panicum virgatum]|uniref:Uncharacterized protein n=1 Tax=Panicum virgatum TaxID=38727 RepID=A0A8T0QZH2_PANVG|nr:hypothetical protein PVAP13_6NG123300 [Panicum virgatum]
MYLQNLLGHGLKKGCHKKKEWDDKIIWHKTRGPFADLHHFVIIFFLGGILSLSLSRPHTTPESKSPNHTRFLQPPCQSGDLHHCLQRRPINGRCCTPGAPCPAAAA